MDHVTASRIFPFACLAFLAACAPRTAAPPAPAEAPPAAEPAAAETAAGPAGTAWADLGEATAVRRVAAGVWLHRTEMDGIAANGAVVATDSGVVLVDTGWLPAQTERLLAWAEAELEAPVKLALLTHSHDDRAGGLSALEARGIAVAALPRTATRLPGGVPPGLRALPEAPVSVAGVEVFYPGAAHAPDNIVVWVPGARVLIGGCAVRSADATTLGFTGDADLESWPLAARRLLERYGHAELVVPGHGEPAGVEALRNTLRLAEAAAAG